MTENHLKNDIKILTERLSVESNELSTFLKYRIIKEDFYKELKIHKSDLNKLSKIDYLNFIDDFSNYFIENAKNKYFETEIKYKCSNPQCEFSFFSKNSYRECPKCKNKFNSDSIFNIEQLKLTLLKDLNQFLYFFIEAEKQTEYLIFEENKQKIIEKTGNGTIKDFLYILCSEKNINIEFLKNIYNSFNQGIDSLLFKFFRENIITKRIWSQNFRPNAELRFFEDKKTYFNCYFPNKYMIVREKKECNIDIKKECPNIHLLISNLTNYREDCFIYIINYLSAILQNPEKRTEKVLNIFGQEASGKGTFFYRILEPLYKYAKIVKMKELESDYTDHYSKSLILFIDEARPNKDLEDELKSIVTASKIDINPKYGKRRTEDNFMNIIIASNHNLSLTMGNRRMVCLKTRSLGKTQEETSLIGSQLNREIPKEIDKFAEFLYNFKYSRMLIENGIDNIEKKDLLNATLSIEKLFLEEFNNFSTFAEFEKQYQNGLNNSELNELRAENIKGEYISLDYLLNLYNNYRKSINNKYSRIAINKFSWIYDELGVSREIDSKEVTRITFNNHKKTAIRIEHILKLFTTIDIKEDIKDYIKKYNYLETKNFSKIDKNIQKVEKGIKQLITKGVIIQSRKDIFHLVGA